VTQLQRSRWILTVSVTIDSGCYPGDAVYKGRRKDAAIVGTGGTYWSSHHIQVTDSKEQKDYSYTAEMRNYLLSNGMLSIHKCSSENTAQELFVCISEKYPCRVVE